MFCKYPEAVAKKFLGSRSQMVKLPTLSEYGNHFRDKRSNGTSGVQHIQSDRGIYIRRIHNDCAVAQILAAVSFEGGNLAQDEWRQVTVQINAQKSSACPDITCKQGLDETGFACACFPKNNNMFCAVNVWEDIFALARRSIRDTVSQNEPRRIGWCPVDEPVP
jgi:hypothetical protein